MKTLVVNPQRYMQMAGELQACMRFVSDTGGGSMYYMGMRVVMQAPDGFCRNCGAPIEPDVCSYCRSPSEYVTVETV